MGQSVQKPTYGGLEIMRNQAESTQDTTPGVVLSAPWRIAEIHVLPALCLSVVFVDGTAGEVDLSRLVNSEKAGIFAALRDPSFFRRVYLEYGVATWPGEIDLAPDAMYDEIKENGKWVLE
jgi:hypothetical protein